MRVLVLALTVSLSGCIVQQPPPQGYAQPQGQAQASPGAGHLPPAAPRELRFNGHAATEQDLATLERLEQQWGARLPAGAYWYDNVSGAAGPWGGPTGGVIQAGLGLGGELPASASGGGDGSLTGVFINGRELHPQDVQALQQMVGQVYQGRWFVDAYGNFGQEGGVVLGNLIQISQQLQSQGRGGDSYYKKDSNGSVFVGGGCVTVDTKDSSGNDTGSYYGGGC